MITLSYAWAWVQMFVAVAIPMALGYLVIVSLRRWMPFSQQKHRTTYAEHAAQFAAARDARRRAQLERRRANGQR
jgi:hypothetical protein